MVVVRAPALLDSRSPRASATYLTFEPLSLATGSMPHEFAVTSLAHASFVHRSLAVQTTILSIAQSAKVSAARRNPGRWTSVHAGVNAPGMPKRIERPGPRTVPMRSNAGSTLSAEATSTSTSGRVAPTWICLDAVACSMRTAVGLKRCGLPHALGLHSCEGAGLPPSHERTATGSSALPNICECATKFLELRELGLQVIRCLRCAALFVGLADEERPPVVEEAGGPIHIRLAPVVVRGWGGIQLYM